MFVPKHFTIIKKIKNKYFFITIITPFFFLFPFLDNCLKEYCRPQGFGSVKLSKFLVLMDIFPESYNQKHYAQYPT